ncbi:outer membrane protein assembly factor BamC [Inmirania thermothiophila]|uniref:outer membrane protein assembly factor BamC n=1 Tax=Inmirania thermothiophila TaxID=1750597 RepID=UPI0011CE3220|nr:outer membrane protein assembly factor BamC [Inmirania thermothiophila]
MRPLLAPALALAVAACGGSGYVNERRVDYGQARAMPELEVPPPLAAPDASQAAALPPDAGVAAAYELAGVRVRRAGTYRWLEVEAPPAEVWGRVRAFLTEQGLAIAHEEPALGILETEWAENRASIRGGFLYRILPKLYSTNTRDRYRVRLEPGERPGTTLVFLTHYGAEEVIEGARGNRDIGTGRWVMRPRDPELEAEMLVRLMAALGQPRQAAEAALAAAGDEAVAVEVEGGSLRLGAEPDRAWRLLGLALDRGGFVVEARDAEARTYLVRPAAPVLPGGGGLLARLGLGRGERAQGPYRLAVLSAEGGSRVVITAADGGPAPDEEAAALARRIAGALR